MSRLEAPVDTNLRDSPRSTIAMLFDWQPVRCKENGARESDCKTNNSIKELTTALLNFAPIDRSDQELDKSSAQTAMILFDRASSIQTNPNPKDARLCASRTVTDSQDSLFCQTRLNNEILRPTSSSHHPSTTITKKLHEPNTILNFEDSAKRAEQSNAKKGLLPTKHNNTKMNQVQQLQHHQLRRKIEASNHLSEGRPRSRAIAIPRPSATSKDDDAIRDLESAMLEYDYATWRLYNRLIVHRQQRRTNAALCFDRVDKVSNNAIADDSIALQDENLYSSSSATSSNAPSLNEEYGGVFDLEL